MPPLKKLGVGVVPDWLVCVAERLFVVQGMGSLDELWLNGNQIQRLEKGVFEGLRDLTKSVSFSANRINQIDREAFSDLVSLRDLNLWGNQLTEIREGYFSGKTTQVCRRFEVGLPVRAIF